MNGKIEIIAPSYKAAKELYGLGTHDTNECGICLNDSQLLELGVKYVDFNQNESRKDAEKIAFSLLYRGNFDAANEIFNKLELRPKEIISHLNDLYRFTGKEKYLRIKVLYESNIFEVLKEDILGDYVEAMKILGEELSELNRDIMRLSESDMCDEIEMKNLKNRSEDLDFKVQFAKSNYRGRMVDLERSFNFSSDPKPRVGFLKRIFSRKR